MTSQQYMGNRGKRACSRQKLLDRLRDELSPHGMQVMYTGSQAVIDSRTAESLLAHWTVQSVPVDIPHAVPMEGEIEDDDVNFQPLVHRSYIPPAAAEYGGVPLYHISPTSPVGRDKAHCAC